jgi:hypothetical protein
MPRTMTQVLNEANEARRTPGQAAAPVPSARQYREWVVYTIEKNHAGRAMINVEFHLDAPYFCINPYGQMVQQQLIDDKIIEA